MIKIQKKTTSKTMNIFLFYGISRTFIYKERDILNIFCAKGFFFLKSTIQQSFKIRFNKFAANLVKQISISVHPQYIQVVPEKSATHPV